MLKLIASRQSYVSIYEPQDCVVSWRVDVVAPTDPDLGDTDSFGVGRLLADEMDLSEIEERGQDPLQVADEDSEGLLHAWAAACKASGGEIDDLFGEIVSGVVYLYRAVLHPDYTIWRAAVVDAFCRIFPDDAIILAQYHTTPFSRQELSRVGFEHIIPAIDHNKVGFLARHNALQHDFTLADYPDPIADDAYATSDHQRWLDDQVDPGLS